MTTPFEHPAELDAQQQERARETFRNLLEESEFDYDVMPGGVIKLTFIGNCGVFVIPDFEHGIMSTDVDTGITLTEERADEAWAFASYSCAFHYNYCLLDTAPAGRVVTKPAWNPGERVHFHTSTLIGARNLRELVSLSLDCATEVRRGVQRILDGESVVDVVHAEDDETSDTMIRHLRDFMTHRHHHFDSEDDEPSPINEAASPAELTSRVVDLFPIAPDKAVGTLWVGTEDRGLVHFFPDSGDYVPIRHPAISDNIHGLCLDGDFLWIGTYDRSKGLVRYNIRTREIKPYPSAGVEIYSIEKTDDGRIWGRAYINQ